MQFIKKLWNKIKEPNGIYLTIFYVFFAGIVAETLVFLILHSEQTVLHYILYAVSAICLMYFIYTIFYISPKIKEKIINVMKKHKFTNSLLADYGYRTIIFSIFSFILNVTYLVFVAVLALITGSNWYISIMAYYLILSLMKANVFYSKKRDGKSIIRQSKTYRFTGIMFLILTFVFSGIIVLIYTSNMYFKYAGLMIYVVAVFTFYKLILAIINIFKAKKQDDLNIQNIRNINLASALISIIVLQVALFQAFSPENNTSIANAITGAIVSLIILTLGVFMIIKSHKILKYQKGKIYKRNKNLSEEFLNDGNKRL